MIDSHCHLADPAFSSDLEEVVRRAVDAGVTGGLCVLALGSAGEARQAQRVLRLWPSMRFAVGLHPHEARAYAGRVDALPAALDEAWAATSSTVALGEVGLDYHYDLSPRDVQREVFRVQVRHARVRRVPLIVHTREADDDTLAILREEGGGGVSGVFHCFSGTAALARAALDIGFHLSFSGIATFPKAGALREIAAFVPEERLLVETDCPYLAPVPCRGRRNEPAWVVHTVAAVAAARSVGMADLERVTTANFERLFGPPRVDTPSATVV
jgi:TatD DNase family protein